MNGSVARRIAPEVRMETGRLVATSPALAVRLSAGVVAAQRAKSCLVAPEPGDRVLCAVEPDAVFVLAVLEGDPGVTIRVDGELDVEAPGGRIALRSSEEVEITAVSAVAITSSDLGVTARRATVAVDELGYVGRLVQAKAGKVALLADELDSIVTRATQRAKRVFRFIEELDQTRAGAVDWRARGLFGIRAEDAMVAARRLAKIDAEQIHLG